MPARLLCMSAAMVAGEAVGSVSTWQKAKTSTGREKVSQHGNSSGDSTEPRGQHGQLSSTHHGKGLELRRQRDAGLPAVAPRTRTRACITMAETKQVSDAALATRRRAWRQTCVRGPSRMRFRRQGRGADAVHGTCTTPHSHQNNAGDTPETGGNIREVTASARVQHGGQSGHRRSWRARH